LLTGETQKTAIIDMLLSLMCLCGWSISNQQSRKAVLSLKQKVESVERVWSQLKKATKENITNTDIEVFNVEPGSTFGEHVEDVYDDTLGKTQNGEPERRCREKILCTVGIGLRKSLVKHEGGGAPLVQREVLIKPKVALASVLLEAGLMGESHPRRQYFGK
jgi:glutamyl/glutaminyl-tRNA synthetase